MPNTRANTRFTLPSRMGERTPALNAAMAAAVERPMPGSVTSTAGSVGNTPPCSSMTAFAQRCRLRARE
ncbi:hypothetical protein D3C81_1520580 [compost metagenome]